MAGLDRGVDSPAAPLQGTFDDFLARLLAVESGVDPALFEWYCRYYTTPIVDYVDVKRPGRARRDRETGRCLARRLTVQQYFQSLGIEDMFKPADPACLRPMQYASMNPLGFVGYQMGESILIQTGFYRPARVSLRRASERCAFDSYYVGTVPDATWRDGRCVMPVATPGRTDAVLATDVNRWRGTFLGKYGVRSLQDLRTEECQERVIRDLMSFNWASLAQALERAGTSLAQELSVVRSIPCTLSGILAAAHLRGADAVAAFLQFGTDDMDEFGTRLTSYLAEFSGFDTPY